MNLVTVVLSKVNILSIIGWVSFDKTTIKMNGRKLTQLMQTVDKSNKHIR